MKRGRQKPQPGRRAERPSPPATIPGTEAGRRPSVLFFLAAVVAVATFAVYLPALGNDFVSLDDYGYVLDNPHIRSLGPEFFRWAFTDLSAGFWHPLTWITYAIDYAVWGLNPLGYHLTAVLFHALNTFLVVLVTGRLLSGIKELDAGPVRVPFLDEPGVLLAAAVTGLLFGLHPLHVESVAWVSERKDVVCACFFLLSLIAWLNYVFARRSGATGASYVPLYRNRAYLLSLVFFVFALAGKTMAVSLPVVLLILDWYPLGRLRSARETAAAVIEKAPFIAASFLISVMSIVAQGSIGALSMMESKPLPVRLFVAFKALVAYLVKMVLPVHLVPHYPYPLKLSFLSAAYLSAVAIAAGITVLALVRARKEKLWLALWGYYVITLLPVLGIVQVGTFSMADRFTYLPSLAPFLLVGLAAARCRSGAAGRTAARVAMPVAVLLLVVLAVLTVNQIGIWKSSMTLWDYTVKNGPPGNSSAYNCRGLVFRDAGQLDRAIEDYTTAILLEPTENAYLVNRGVALGEKGELDRAMADLNAAIALRPKEYMAYNNRGNILYKKGELDRSVADFTRAVALKPAEYLAYYNRAFVLCARGELDRAIDDYSKVLLLNPALAGVYADRGRLYQKKGMVAPAVNDFRQGCAAGSDEACRAARTYEGR